MNTKLFQRALLLTSAALFGQDTAVTITGTGPVKSTATVKVNYKNALVTFSAANVVIDGTGTAVMPISILNRTGQLPTAVQSDFNYAASDITGATFALGSAAVAAGGKTINCAPLAAPATGYRCLVSGGVTVIGNGPVIVATLATKMTSQATSTVTLLGTVAANSGASAIPTAIAPGGGVISMPALIATVTCSSPDIEFGQTVNCSATLNKAAPTGGATVALASDSTLVGIPSTVTIPAGSTSVSFALQGQ